MAQILLTHSYFRRFDPKEFRAMMPYPPLGTLYAASYLRRAGFSVALHDVMLSHREEEIIEPLKEHAPEVVVIYDDQFNYLSKMCLTRMRQAAFRLTQLARERGCKVVIFSSDATDHLNEYIHHGADYVLCGEAEETLTELVTILVRRSGTPVDQIRGLAFAKDGAVIRTPPRNILENLDVLPLPAWDLLDIDQYRKAWLERHGYFSLNLVTTRGCPFHCNWCAKPIYGQVYHSRSPEKVVEELLLLKQTGNPDHVWFADDIFGLKPGWISHFDEAVNAAHAKIPFKCLSRVDLLLKENNIAHLRHAGCETVWVGAESGSQKVLDAMEKGTTVPQIHRASTLLHEAGIRVGFFLQYGYPGETRDDIEQTLSMVKQCKPDEIGISVSYPLPGTRFYERVKNDLENKENWVDSGDLDLMFHGTYSPDFYRALHRFTHKKFRVWQAKDILRNVLAHPLKADRLSIRRIAASAYHAVTLPRLESEMNSLSAQLTRGTNG
jgi:anaerobic magnesium-protoporphyrin IX monomethyl ester cyclase